MIVISLLLALVIWGFVSFGPANVQTRTVTATVKIDLAGTSVGYNDLRVIGQDTFYVDIEVEGTRSVIYSLTGEDLIVKPTLTDIQGPGKSEVSINVNKGGKTTAYTVNSITPSSVTVQCDYWTSASFNVEADTAKLKVQDVKTQQKGDVLLDSALADGRVTLEGPRDTLLKVNKVVARVEDEATIDKTSRFTARLLALDANGSEVDIAECRFTGLSENKVELTVPVWVQRVVDLKYTLANVPAGLSQNGLVKLSHNRITLVGEADTLNAIAATVGNLGTVDFDRLLPENADYTVEIKVPGGVKVLEGTSVAVSVAIDQFTTRTLSYSVRSLNDVTLQNLPEGKVAAIQQQKLDNIVVCGSNAALRRLNANDLKLTADVAAVTGSGAVRYPVRITVPSQPSVWVYYGAEGTNPYQVYGTLE